MAKKKKSKFKKILKTLGKVAALGGAAYGASKLFGGSKPTMALGSSCNRSDQIGPLNPYKVKKDFMKFPEKGLGVGVDRVASPYERSRIGQTYGVLKDGGRVKKAKVTGAAKRGFGRALMKGKK